MNPIDTPEPPSHQERLRQARRRLVARDLLGLAALLMSREEAEAMDEQERERAVRVCDAAKDAIRRLPYGPEAYPPVTAALDHPEVSDE